MQCVQGGWGGRGEGGGGCSVGSGALLDGSMLHHRLSEPPAKQHGSHRVQGDTRKVIGWLA